MHGMLDMDLKAMNNHLRYKGRVDIKTVDIRLRYQGNWNKLAATTAKNS